MIIRTLLTSQCVPFFALIKVQFFFPDGESIVLVKKSNMLRLIFTFWGPRSPKKKIKKCSSVTLYSCIKPLFLRWDFFRRSSIIEELCATSRDAMIVLCQTVLLGLQVKGDPNHPQQQTVTSSSMSHRPRLPNPSTFIDRSYTLLWRLFVWNVSRAQFLKFPLPLFKRVCKPATNSWNWSLIVSFLKRFSLLELKFLTSHRSFNLWDCCDLMSAERWWSKIVLLKYLRRHNFWFWLYRKPLRVGEVNFVKSSCDYLISRDNLANFTIVLLLVWDNILMWYYMAACLYRY